MHEFTATVSWERGAQPFLDQRYSRAHIWQFDGGAQVAASSSPLSVPVPMSDAANVDPEEALVAAVSSCHMLFFLSLAAQRGLIVERYQDHAVGEMDRNAHGKIAMTKIILRPAVTFAGTAGLKRATLDAIHHSAHEQCYIANSITAEVLIDAITTAD